MRVGFVDTVGKFSGTENNERLCSVEKWESEKVTVLFHIYLIHNAFLILKDSFLLKITHLWAGTILMITGSGVNWEDINQISKWSMKNN